MTKYFRPVRKLNPKHRCWEDPMLPNWSKSTIVASVPITHRRTIMNFNGKFLCSCISSFVRGLFPIPGSSRIVPNNGSDLLSRRDISIKLLSCNIFENVFFLSNSNLFG